MSDEHPSPWVMSWNIAAVVHDDGVAADALMSVFARSLTDAGVAIGGVVQLPPEGEGCGPSAPMRLQDVATGEIISICQDLGTPQGGRIRACALDPAGLAEGAVRIMTAVDRGAELVFASKFGKQEAAGKGMRDAMTLAALTGRPMLTSVRRGLVHNFLEFTGGLGTLLDSRLWVLEDWWRDASGLTVATAAATERARVVEAFVAR